MKPGKKLVIAAMLFCTIVQEPVIAENVTQDEGLFESDFVIEGVEEAVGSAQILNDETGTAEGPAEDSLSGEQAVSAVRRYCHINDPDLENIENAGEYPVYWDVESEDGNGIVVLFRSYTGAQIRYYIDRVTGETFVTEFVPGITSEEEQTDESFNVREYLSPITGTWQTASMGYEYYGTPQAEYYVRFTDTEIIYGHLKDSEFVPDHSDGITFTEETASGGFLVQAESAGGVRYTYRTCGSDDNVLEYYETWQEEDFPEAYRGGASLSRIPDIDF